MFGKRKDHKHRFAEEAPGSPDGEARPEPDDPELAEALLQLGRNRHVPLHPRQRDEASEPGRQSEPDHGDQDESGAPDESNVPDRTVRSVVPTAAMLAEPEPAAGEAEPTSTRDFSTFPAPKRDHAKGSDQDAGAQKAQDEPEPSLRESQSRIEELTAQRKSAKRGGRSESSSAAAERSGEELRSEVSALKAELEVSRSEAAAAGVALERIEREAKHQDGTVAAAEERAERLAAEIEQLRAAAATAPAQVERLHREAERERTLRTAMDQAQRSQVQAEAALSDNLRLAGELAANLRSQEGLITALTGLQAEITEQRAWFEAQIANAGEAESQQAMVIESLQTALQDRDIELEVLRQHLLEAEAKRAEEAAAFVAALERP